MNLLIASIHQLNHLITLHQKKVNQFYSKKSCRAAFVIGRKTNNELPDDMKEELKGISWDDFMASLQEVTALESRFFLHFLFQFLISLL